jgi:hypothetical protein
MQHERLERMVKGWFVGDFEPAALRTSVCEVALKQYKAGDCEILHHHKVAIEVTLIVSGRVRMQGKEWGPGDIIVLDPGEATTFEALTDAVNVVVKTPSSAGDKYDGVFEEQAT